MTDRQDKTAKLAQELGTAAVEKLTEDLSEWYAYDTFASTYGFEMTPATMVAWAKFAEQVARQTGREVVISRDGTVRAMKPYRERVQEALLREVSRREREAEDVAS